MNEKEKNEKNQEASALSIPLEYIKYNAAVNGASCRVRVDQHYKNLNQKPVEAIYVFPLPADSSVGECALKIGKRKPIQAELKKRDEAKREYQEARDAGHHASLLEQERDNIFTMSTAGIEPGENADVFIDYVQRIPWQAGGGRFTLPLTVAPRFIPGNPTGKQAGGWSPDTDEVPDASRITPVVAKEGVSYQAEISILFSPGFRCKLTCPSHPNLVPERIVAKGETVEIKTGKIATDRDFVLVYESLSKVAEVSEHFCQHGGESFVLASVFPPGEAKPVGADYVLLLDCSGSMDGESIVGLRSVAKQILKNMRERKVGDRVGILPFSNQPLASYPLSEISDNHEKFIDRLNADGGTALGYAFAAAEKMFEAADSSSRQKMILLVTDGDTEHGKDWRNPCIRLVAVGIGTAIDDDRIVSLAKNNNGTYEFVHPGEDCSAVANRLAGYLSGPVLRDVKVETKGEAVGVSDVFKGRPATISIRFDGNEPGAIRVTGKDQDGNEQSWNLSAKNAKFCDYAYKIWAKEKIRSTSDAEAQVVVSLKYKVQCAGTAFVVKIEKEKPGEKPVTVEVPCMLPKGWNFESVFGGAKGVRFMGAARYGLVGAIQPMAFMDTGFAGSDEELCEEVVAESLEMSMPEESPACRGVCPRSVAPVSNRFLLDAQNIDDRLIAILIHISGPKSDKAREAFGELRLTPRDVKKMNEETRARACYFSVRLQGCGLHFDRKVMAELMMPPTKSDLAKAWFALAQKESGRAVNAKVIDALFVQLLNKADAIEVNYIMWKNGKAARPAINGWDLVP